MSERTLVGRSSVERALGLARQNATTAAIALTLVPLAALSAHATGSVPTYVTITGTPGGTPGDYTIAYTVTNTSPDNRLPAARNDVVFNGADIIEVEIPEIHLGDLVFASNGSGSVGGVFGWAATENPNADLNGSGLYSGTPGAYIDLAVAGYSGSGIAPGQSETFTASVKTNLTTNAAFAVGFDNEATVTVDPIIPQTNAVVTVPEPSSFAAMGTALLGLLWFRRRKA